MNVSVVDSVGAGVGAPIGPFPRYQKHVSKVNSLG